MALTIKQIATLSAAGRYGDGHGLYLQITLNGTKSWLLRYQRSGHERWMGLGPLHTIDLHTARKRAQKARQQLLDGIDPLDARKEERNARALEAAKTISFEQAALQYFEQHEQKWRNAKHRDQFLSTLRAYAFPTIGHLSVSAIETGLVLKCIEPIWKTKTETASRVRNRIETVLDWATVRGLRKGENPARWRGHLDNVLPARMRIAKPQHHAALPYADVPAFVKALQTRPAVAARALEFLILTAARTGEVVGATWREIDLDAGVWLIPADRIKACKEHRVPLSGRALAILRDLPREDYNPFVFIGPRKGGLSNMAMASVLGRMDRNDITVACTRFRRHRVRCFHGTGGASWSGGSLRESSSLRRCA